MSNNYLDFNSSHGKTEKINSSTHPQHLKIVVLGKGVVGKTSIIFQITNKSKEFRESYFPTIEDRYMYEYYFEEKKIELEILDTAGEDDYHNMIDIWLLSSDCLLLVFSVESRSSFDELNVIYERVRKVKGMDFPILLIGNKTDLPQREVDNIDGINKAKEWNADYLETSAKTGDNCDKILKMIIPKAIENKERFEQMTEGSGDFSNTRDSFLQNRGMSKLKFNIIFWTCFFLISGSIGIIIWRCT